MFYDGSRIMRGFFWRLCQTSLFRKMDDESYLRFIYPKMVGGNLNLSQPKRLTEKLQWLKLNVRKDEYTIMVDKCDAKNYAAKIIGNQYIIPTLGVWNNFDEITFDQLPNQFVLKCTHDSGGLVIVKDKAKLDIDSARHKIETSLKRNFYWHGREWPYKNVRPRIIAEEYIFDADNVSKPIDNYKFFCSKGNCFAFYVAIGGGHNSGMSLTYFDREKNRLPVSHYTFSPAKDEIVLPVEIDEMIELAELLSSDLYFGRIDFYCVNGRIYFGEITFFPDSGLLKYTPEEYDDIWGNYIELPIEGGHLNGE